MKNTLIYVYAIIGITLGIGITMFADAYTFRLESRDATTMQTFSETTATTTYTSTLPRVKVYTLESDHPLQGACLKIKNSNSHGYTYITAANGVLTSSTISCE